VMQRGDDQGISLHTFSHLACCCNIESMMLDELPRNMRRNRVGQSGDSLEPPLALMFAQHLHHSTSGGKVVIQE
jgi:hypothetical protein